MPEFIVCELGLVGNDLLLPDHRYRVCVVCRFGLAFACCGCLVSRYFLCYHVIMVPETNRPRPTLLTSKVDKWNSSNNRKISVIFGGKFRLIGVISAIRRGHASS